MARIPVPIVVAVAVLFFSLTLSTARIPANVPGNEVSKVELPPSLPESDAKSIIRLPLDEAESHPDDPVKETQESEALSTVQSAPLNLVTFRPVDHRFRLRSRFPFRCRHHHHRHRFFIPMRQQHQEIPYGDDMILATGENADFDQGMFHGGVRQIPARWVKLHHYHHHHDDEDEDSDGISKLMFRHSDVFDKEKFKKHKNHHQHEDDEEEDGGERFKEHKERKEKGGGFMKRIRKILDHF